MTDTMNVCGQKFEIAGNLLVFDAGKTSEQGFVVGVDGPHLHRLGLEELMRFMYERGQQDTRDAVVHALFGGTKSHD